MIDTHGDARLSSNGAGNGTRCNDSIARRLSRYDAVGINYCNTCVARRPDHMLVDSIVGGNSGYKRYGLT